MGTAMNDNLRDKIGEFIVNVEAIILKTKLKQSPSRGKSQTTPTESAQE